jgi:hypothetical protein
VNLLDWNLWKAHLGLPALEISSAGASSVPEPGVLGMLVIGVCGLLVRVWRKRV